MTGPSVLSKVPEPPACAIHCPRGKASALRAWISGRPRHATRVLDAPRKRRSRARHTGLGVHRERAVAIGLTALNSHKSSPTLGRTAGALRDGDVCLLGCCAVGGDDLRRYKGRPMVRAFLLGRRMPVLALLHHGAMRRAICAVLVPSLRVLEPYSDRSSGSR